jgi:hypothetical protein
VVPEVLVTLLEQHRLVEVVQLHQAPLVKLL